MERLDYFTQRYKLFPFHHLKHRVADMGSCFKECIYRYTPEKMAANVSRITDPNDKADYIRLVEHYVKPH